MDLQRLALMMVADGLAAEYAAAADDDEVNRVRVTAQTEGFAQPLTLTVTQVDVTAGSAGGHEMVQLFAPLPVELSADEAAALLPLANEANEAVPLIGFGVNPGAGFLYYRHVLLAPAGDTGLQLVTEAAWMALFALDLHAAALIRAVKGA